MLISETKFKSYKKEVFDSPSKIAQLMKNILWIENEIDREKEHLYVIGFNTRNNIKYIELVTLGLLDSSLAHPREVFRLAISQAVKRIVLVHNHPSGNLEPSKQDIGMTKQVYLAGEIIGIDLLDHIIIPNNEDGYTSVFDVIDWLSITEILEKI